MINPKSKQKVSELLPGYTEQFRREFIKAARAYSRSDTAGNSTSTATPHDLADDFLEDAPIEDQANVRSIDDEIEEYLGDTSQCTSPLVYWQVCAMAAASFSN